MAKKQKNSKTQKTERLSRSSAPTKKQPRKRKTTPKTSPASKPSGNHNNKEPFPIVGIGASAGGLSALKTLFANVPENSGLTFVVVVHLSPEHKSHLAEVLQPHIQMPVQQVTETVALEPNRVYVIPPNANLNTIDTHLRLSDLEAQRRERAPIDHFFRTLANTHDGHAIGVILSGTGSDGTLGIKDIKASGGLTIVQDPNQAEYDGMPQSSITTGMVDLVLPLEEIPEAVLRFSRTRPRVPLPHDGHEIDHDQRQLLLKIFALIRARTGRDFSRYKRSTIFRRITRRMQLVHTEEVDSYLEYLRNNSTEIRALSDDLLITVTHFFRDTDVFEELENGIIAKLFDDKSHEDSVRVWSVGCSTGEEAYSLAMLLLEEAARRDLWPRLQVFASDLHEHSLVKAREGFYPGDISTDMSPARLKRFFQEESGGYRISKEVREIVVFAPHNLLSDPPFSRIDLIACRNLLIYLQREVHRDVAELFHYALSPNGFLLLGNAETIETAELFRLENKKSCIYRKRNVPGPEPRLPVFPVTRPSLLGEPEKPEQPSTPMAFGTMHQRMVEQYAPPSILITPDAKVVHLSQNAGRYLVHPGGDPTTSVFRLVREELRLELRTAIHTAKEAGQATTTKPVMLRFDGVYRAITIHVRPATEPQHDGFSLIIFDEREVVEQKTTSKSLESENRNEGENSAQIQQRLSDQDDELDLAQQRLQAIIEEYETSQEEMKASNEELQSSNEELRSTMEELETSKEELQSMNEELQTVNQENRHKVEELAQLTSDLQNLLAATDIATLFLDRELRILRFTPKVEELFNVRMADRGRTISDFTHRLGYSELQHDAQLVLAKLMPIEREVRDESGRWYLTRVLPYRSAEDRIEGVVITFVEITHRKDAEVAQRRSEEFLRLAVEAAKVGTWDINMETGDCLISAQSATLLGLVPEQQVLSRERWEAVIYPADRPLVEESIAEAISERKPVQLEYRVARLPHDIRWLYSKGSVEQSASEETLHLRGASIDITDLKQTEEALRESEECLRQAAEAARFGSYSYDMVTDAAHWTPELYAILGLDPHERLDLQRIKSMVYADDQQRFEEFLEQALHSPEGVKFSGEFRFVHPDGKLRWLADQGMVIYAGEGASRKAVRAVGMVIDVTARKSAESELQQLNESLEEQVVRRTTMMNILQDVTRAANQATTVTEAFYQTLQRVSQYNGWQVGHVWKRADDGSGDLVSTGVWHVAEEKASAAVDQLEQYQRLCQQVRIPAGQMVVGKVAQENKPNWIDEIRSSDDWHLGNPRELGLKAVIAFPVTIHGIVVAVLEFYSNHPTKREDRFMEIMPDIGIQLGHVIERQRLEKAIDTATTEQQRSIGQDLHDGVAQELTGCSMLAESLRLGLLEEKSSQTEQAAKLVSYLNDANRQVRLLSRGLIPVEIEEEGLMQALELQALYIEELFKVKCSFRCDQPVILNNNEVATHLYRIAQEATQNAAKHGEPETIEIQLERDDEQIVLTIRDNGQGMSDFNMTGSGQRIMRHRAALIGGEFNIQSEPGDGVIVSCRVPHKLG